MLISTWCLFFCSIAVRLSHIRHTIHAIQVDEYTHKSSIIRISESSWWNELVLEDMMFGDGNAVSQLWSIGMKMSTAECFSSLCVTAFVCFMEGVFRHSHGLLHGQTCVISYGAKSLSWIKTSNLGLVTIKHRKVTYNLTDVFSPRTPYKSDRATAMVGQLSKLGFDLDFCFWCLAVNHWIQFWQVDMIHLVLPSTKHVTPDPKKEEESGAFENVLKVFCLMMMCHDVPWCNRTLSGWCLRQTL